MKSPTRTWRRSSAEPESCPDLMALSHNSDAWHHKKSNNMDHRLASRAYGSIRLPEKSFGTSLKDLKGPLTLARSRIVSLERLTSSNFT